MSFHGRHDDVQHIGDAAAQNQRQGDAAYLSEKCQNLVKIANQQSQSPDQNEIQDYSLPFTFFPLVSPFPR